MLCAVLILCCFFFFSCHQYFAQEANEATPNPGRTIAISRFHVDSLSVRLNASSASRAPLQTPNNSIDIGFDDITGGFCIYWLCPNGFISIIGKHSSMLLRIYSEVTSDRDTVYVSGDIRLGKFRGCFNPRCQRHYSQNLSGRSTRAGYEGDTRIASPFEAALDSDNDVTSVDGHSI